MKFKDFLTEKVDKHAVMAFGRMNPLTSGHGKLVDKVKSVAQRVGGTHHIVVSHSQDSNKNPLSASQKIKHAKRAFPNTNITSSSREHPTFLQHAAKLHKSGATHLHMVAGSDRVPEYKKKLNQYNGTHKGALYNYKKITVHSAGQRDPDAEGTTGISASKMRGHASSGDYNSFKKGTPKNMSHSHAKEMYNDVRKGMNIREEYLEEGVHDKGIFKAVFLAGGPGSGKDYVLKNTLNGHGLTELNSDKALEYLMDKKGLDKKMPDNEEQQRDATRKKAKNISELRHRLALHGRNGLIINGTGGNIEKYKKIKDELEELGYDTTMMMVNTSDEVSQKRNQERGEKGGRSVPEKIRKQKFDEVQNNVAGYKKMFGDKFIEFDNSEDLRSAKPEIVTAKKDEMTKIFKMVRKFTEQKPEKSDLVKMWSDAELKKTNDLPIKKDVIPHPDSGHDKHKEQTDKLGLDYYGFGRYGKNGKVTHRSINGTLEMIQKNENTINNSFNQFMFESIDKGIEPGISMAGAGESIARDMGEKIRKRLGKANPVISKPTISKEESNPRIPRKEGQPANSKKHSDLYTDENPKGTIHGLGFKDVATSKASVSKIKKSNRTHAHKIQAAVAMEQRAREMGKSSEAAVYRKFINSMKEKTKKMNKEEYGAGFEGTTELANKYKKVTPGQKRKILTVTKKIDELTGDTTGASIGDQKEGELKRKGISLTTFRANRKIAS